VRPKACKMELHRQTRVEQCESIRRGFAEIEAGHYIPHEAMKTWLLSSRSNPASPAPRNVCGGRHDMCPNLDLRLQKL
jgi:hypothetical protein